MPFVRIAVTREGVTAQQKRALIEGATGLLKVVLDKDPETTHVVIEEIDTDSWGVGGRTVTERRSGTGSRKE